MFNRNFIILVFIIASAVRAMRNNKDFASFFDDFNKEIAKQEAAQKAFFNRGGFDSFAHEGENFGGGQSKRVVTKIGPDGQVVRQVFVNGKEVKEEDQDFKKLDGGNMFDTLEKRFKGKPDRFDPDQSTFQVKSPNKIIVEKFGCKDTPKKERQDKAPQQPSSKPQPLKTGSGDTLRQASDELFRMLNNYRESKGISKVAHDEDIYDQCFEHSKFMKTHNTLTHNGFQERVQALPYSSFSSAENVAMFGMSISDPKAIAEQVINQWKNSKGHNANMLNKNCNTASAAVYGSNGSFYATMILVQKG